MYSVELRSGHNSRNAKRGSHVLSGCKDSEPRECNKDSSHGLLGMLESELKVLSSESVDILKLCGGNQLIEEFYSQRYCDDASKLDQQFKDYNPSVYSYKDRPLHMLQNVVGDGSQETSIKTDTGGFMDLEYYSYVDSAHTKKACTEELDSEWIGVEKAEPWWRKADKELAASGSPKSSGCIGNSDISWRQCLGVESYNCSQCSSQVITDEKKFLLTSECYPGQHPSQSQNKRLCVGKGCSTHASRQPISGDEELNTAKVLSDETQPGSNDLTKGQLLEALCHSQTRAREAEQLAQQAYNEKEHVIKLFFRQASHLFAYRQWLQILQLEALCLQLRNKDQNSTDFSPFLLSVPSKGRKLKKCRSKPIKKKQVKGKGKLNKSAVAFALGLGLVGAGLLLGWTMGWLFPAF